MIAEVLRQAVFEEWWAACAAADDAEDQARVLAWNGRAAEAGAWLRRTMEREDVATAARAVLDAPWAPPGDA